MSCARCNESSTYDFTCQDCRTRLVRSCRSKKAPAIARRQQDAMLEAISRNQGESVKRQTIEQLRAKEAA